MSEEEEQKLYREGANYRIPAGNDASVSPLESKSFEKKLRRIMKQKERKQKEKEQKLAGAGVSSVEKESAIPAVLPERIIERYLNSRKQKQVRVSE